ncbi:kynureninase [Salinispirillum sp. LH 10-3-1]|uniref:Kynureninase n=1 Tax=Salinispirillum sp. LH 10-3-1 TaxID=2952525 RepID=A0AB38YCC8_9GAMM
MSLALYQQMDAADPLADVRSQFQLPEGIIYLDGNSLGCMPKATAARMRAVIEDEWGNGLIRSWNSAHWIDLPQRLGSKIATLLGADSDEVLVTDSTSVNIFKLATAALRLRPSRHKIITEPGNFPTDRYILQGLCDFSGNAAQLVTIPAQDIIDAIDEDTALVVLTHVHYKSGALHDMKAITARAHAKGALILWDLSHSTGAVPLALNECDVDLAVGCGYKYLNGGPGAPAFVYVAKRLQEGIRQPIYGWFGHAQPFAMQDDYAPATGITQMLTGTTSVLGASALEVGLDIFSTVDMSALRHKSQALTDLLIELVEQRCADFGFALASPRDADARGSQVSFRHPEGYAIMQALIDRGVIGDFRAPDIVRFGVAPLYVSYEDIGRAVDVLADIMTHKHWDQPRFKAQQAVT